jgi:hypothetical protein
MATEPISERIISAGIACISAACMCGLGAACEALIEHTKNDPTLAECVDKQGPTKHCQTENK